MYASVGYLMPVLANLYIGVLHFMFELRRVHGDFHTTLESEVSLFRRLKCTQALVLGEGICVLFRDRRVLNSGCPF